MRALTAILDRVCAETDKYFALATLVATKGSTYRKPGARLLVDSLGATIGVLSGGCLEEEIARVGKLCIADGEARQVEFDTKLLFGCDGHLRILVERLSPAREGNFLTEVAGRFHRRLSTRVCVRHGDECPGSSVLESPSLVPSGKDVFLETVSPAIRLFVIGNGPEIQPLRQLCEVLGWQCEQAQDARALQPDSQTAALVMTHNFGRDTSALHDLIPQGLRYVGLLGPRRRQARILSCLPEAQVLSLHESGSLHSPAGLDIGSESPEEIALSIVSEISARLAGREGGCLRDRQAPVHTHTLVA